MSSLLLLHPPKHTSVAGSVKLSPLRSQAFVPATVNESLDGFRQAAPQVAIFGEVARLGAADAQASRGDSVQPQRRFHAAHLSINHHTDQRLSKYLGLCNCSKAEVRLTQESRCAPLPLSALEPPTPSAALHA